MKISGVNLGEKEVEYNLLSEYNFFDDGRQKNVKRLEQLYLSFQEESKKTVVTPFPQEDGKVVLSTGMINHKCSGSLEILRTISQYGILASEWFGQAESEGEGAFCTFVDRIHEENSNDDRRKKRAILLNSKMLKSMDNDVLLFFDETNSIFKQLLHLDYFEYEKVKNQSLDKLIEIYNEEEIELFEQIIAPFSLGGRTFHTKGILPYCDWSAIPGGIPSKLINGICIKNNNFDKEYIEKVEKLFPNATIFKGNLEILYSPIKNTNKLIKEAIIEQTAQNEKFISQNKIR